MRSLLSIATVITASICTLAACTSPQPAATQPGSTVTAVAPSPALLSYASRWSAMPLPGKRLTEYSLVAKDGQRALRADSRQSASLWRLKLDGASWPLGDVAWSWWVDAPLPGARLDVAERADSPVRLVFAFDGDASRLSPRERALSDLARTLTGEAAPYATLMYVWGSEDQAEGAVIVSRRSERIRKIVVDAGQRRTGGWSRHRRNLLRDFQQAFGEPPGRLLSIAVMTDTDNTGTSTVAWYGPIEWLATARGEAAGQPAAASALGQPL